MFLYHLHYCDLADCRDIRLMGESSFTSVVTGRDV